MNPARQASLAREINEVDAPLEVLLLHEDLQTGLRAKSLLGSLEAKLSVKPRFLVELWRFDMLHDPELQERAVQEAARANMVMISMHGQHELPAVVRNWLSRWTEARNGEACALVASFDANVKGSVTANQTLDHLRRTAAPAGVDVFPHFGDVPASLKDRISQDSRPRPRPFIPESRP
jgi:hypothetical protein